MQSGVAFRRPLREVASQMTDHTQQVHTRSSGPVQDFHENLGRHGRKFSTIILGDLFRLRLILLPLSLILLHILVDFSRRNRGTAVAAFHKRSGSHRPSSNRVVVLFWEKRRLHRSQAHAWCEVHVELDT